MWFWISGCQTIEMSHSTSQAWRIANHLCTLAPSLHPPSLSSSWNRRTERGSFAPGSEEAAPVVPEAAAPALGEPMDLMTALQLVIKKSLAHDGVARGLHEGAKAIEKHAAQLCLLAEDCDQPDYVKLVKALCAEHNVHLVTVPSAKTLGEWAGVSSISRKITGSWFLLFPLFRN